MHRHVLAKCGNGGFFCLDCGLLGDQEFWLKELFGGDSK